MKTVRIRKCSTEAKIETRATQRVTVKKVNAGFKVKNLNTHICDHIAN